MFAIAGSRSARLSSVVLPLPRKPVRMVTGVWGKLATFCRDVMPAHSRSKDGVAQACHRAGHLGPDPLARLCRGHPRLGLHYKVKTWMAGTSPAMTVTTRPRLPLSLVTTGLDPVVHAGVRLSMDCRIKSGNDEMEGAFSRRDARSRFAASLRGAKATKQSRAPS